MRVIGVTGGVGAGKSTVLGILEEDFQAYVIQADQLGHIPVSYTHLTLPTTPYV